MHARTDTHTALTAPGKGMQTLVEVNLIATGWGHDTEECGHEEWQAPFSLRVEKN